MKNTVLASASRVILFVGRTFAGSTHDYTMLKTEFPVDEAWFTTTEVLLDLGYQGVQTDYPGDCISLPHKKPRKSKKNPDPQLSVEQKQENRALARLRVFIEHAIAGIKRFRILVAPYRNHKDDFEDDVLVVASGLWNFWLS